MADPILFVEGWDPTADPGSCISRANLLAMIKNAQPESIYGYVIVSASTPDVATYPVLERFLWLDTSDYTLKYYNGSSWTAVGADAVISSTTVDISKLDPTGGAAYQIIAVNASATAFFFTTVIEMITARSLPLVKLASANPGMFIGSSKVDGQNTWIAGPIDSLLPVQSIGRDKLKTSTVELEIDTGVVLVDALAARNFTLELTEDVTEITINGLQEGDSIQIKVFQDGTGSWVISGWTDVNFPDATEPTCPADPDYGMVVSVTNFGGVLNGVYVLNYHA